MGCGLDRVGGEPVVEVGVGGGGEAGLGGGLDRVGGGPVVEVGIEDGESRGWD